jgi:cysteine desulfurase
MKIYLDNAATTPIDEAVLDAMLPFYTQFFGNPSSVHTHGRETKSAVEKARKTIANLLRTSPAQIFFTSGGTEADNTAILGIIEAEGIKNVISSSIEHHAVLHTLEKLAKLNQISLHFVPLENDGSVSLPELERMLQMHPKALVSLMHGNNEIGNLLDLDTVSELCKAYGAYFHSDTVQTMGHYAFNLQQTRLDFLVGSAHKFHGPKGVGFMYLREGIKIPALINGGAQERNLRGGTENVAGIVGLAKALELSYQNLEKDRHHILNLKSTLQSKLVEILPEISFNGLSGNLDKSLYTVLSVLFPKTEIAEMLLFNLDINKISVSGGSACTSGSLIGSHVLNTLYGDLDERPAVRFSFSKFNTLEEIDKVVAVVADLFLEPKPNHALRN